MVPIPRSLGMATKPSRFYENVYRWEDNPSLNHSCAICGVCLNSPRAKKTCFGVHAVPCVRYHQTLFRIGRAHSCEACKNSNEQHDKRHREIGVLIRKIQEVDGIEDTDADMIENRRRSVSSEIPSIPEVESMDEQESMTPPKTKPSETPPLSVAIPDGRHVDGITSPTSSSSPSPGSSKAKVIRLQKHAARTARTISKMFQRQTRRALPTSTPRDFTEEINIAIHGHPRMPPTVDQEESDNALQIEIENFRNLQQQLLGNKENHPKTIDAGLRLKRSDSKRATNIEWRRNTLETECIVSIMNKLGIKPSFSEGPRERQQLVQELGSSVIVDIEIVANEAKETLKRKEGYWRYANRRTYNEMVRSNQLVNWETGERLRELDAEDAEQEDEIIEEQEEEDTTLDESAEHVEGHNDAIEPDSTSALEEAYPNDNTVKQTDEKNLVLKKSPGKLIFSLEPAREKAELKAVEQEQTESERPEDSPPEGTTPHQEEVAIEPIITHKRRTSKRYKKRPHRASAENGNVGEGPHDMPLQAEKTRFGETSIEDPQPSRQQLTPETADGKNDQIDMPPTELLVNEAEQLKLQESPASSSATSSTAGPEHENQGSEAPTPEVLETILREENPEGRISSAIPESEEPKQGPRMEAPISSTELPTDIVFGANVQEPYQTEKASINEQLKIETGTLPAALSGETGEEETRQSDSEPDFYRPQLLGNKRFGPVINAKTRAAQEKIYNRVFASKIEQSLDSPESETNQKQD